MANKKADEKQKQQAQTGADIDLQTEAEKEAEVQEKESVQVAATYSTMNINKANGANAYSNRPSEAEMKRELEYAKQVLETKSKKSVSIPKQMAQYIGDTMVSCINGACVRIPVDGESYEVAEPYYDLIMNSLKTIHAGDVRAEYGFGDKVNDDALKR